MIFSKDHIPLIEQGRKWQTRRLDRGRRPATVGSIQGIRSSYKERPVGYIKILALYRQKLIDSVDTMADIRAEGYRDVRTFDRVFCRLNHLPDPYDPVTGQPSTAFWQILNRELWVVVFQYVGKEAAKP